MKEAIYKIAAFLAIVSILPFVIFMARRESPPEKFHVETHKKQLIKNFTLESKGEKRSWVLRAPEAVFEGNKEIILKFPELELLEKERVLIHAESAIYNQETEELFLENVSIESENLSGKTRTGTYSTSKGVFVTHDTCEVTLKNRFTVEGKECILDLKNKRVIIQSKVKSILREEGK
ncbi:LPS export ABC transporter periplasmic protein LptC [Phorcysia thermohydrogeniphila]|uniref:Lipopolysaccharide-assembly LptC-related protein n=1 Tax=Phorcysia thermohydrogeniphila TaxID=936138 RepID=A0A4R1GKQ5_9BACT|nr:LPS export ABC transporter periplasmic protein LptC [Phorcysia thermohydrogeniphila]TCK06649.1 lipopolysaccharide-assembly LptC-related protein [Phorcysia thermohydrogeniphila]